MGAGTRHRIEVGKKDRVRPGSIVGAIAGEGGINGRDIGNIEIYPTFSLVDITADLSDAQLSKIAKGYVSGRAMRIRVDEGPGKGRSDGFDRAERFDRSDRPSSDRQEREYAWRYEDRDRFDRDDRRERGFKGRDSRSLRGQRFERDDRGQRGGRSFGKHHYR